MYLTRPALGSTETRLGSDEYHHGLQEVVIEPLSLQTAEVLCEPLTVPEVLVATSSIVRVDVHATPSTTSVAEANLDESATDLAVMVVVPAAIAVAVPDEPEPLTEATLGFDELQVTAWFTVDGRIQEVKANVRESGQPVPMRIV